MQTTKYYMFVYLFNWSIIYVLKTTLESSVKFKVFEEDHQSQKYYNK